MWTERAPCEGWKKKTSSPSGNEPRVLTLHDLSSPPHLLVFPGEKKKTFTINNQWNISPRNHDGWNPFDVECWGISSDWRIQYNAIQCNTIQCNTMQYNTIQYNTMQYNAIQYNAIQYNTMQCNTIQYNILFNMKKHT